MVGQTVTVTAAIAERSTSIRFSLTHFSLSLVPMKNRNALELIEQNKIIVVYR